MSKAWFVVGVIVGVAVTLAAFARIMGELDEAGRLPYPRTGGTVQCNDRSRSWLSSVSSPS